MLKGWVSAAFFGCSFPLQSLLKNKLWFRFSEKLKHQCEHLVEQGPDFQENHSQSWVEFSAKNVVSDTKLFCELMLTSPNCSRFKKKSKQLIQILVQNFLLNFINYQIVLKMVKIKRKRWVAFWNGKQTNKSCLSSSTYDQIFFKVLSTHNQSFKSTQYPTP